MYDGTAFHGSQLQGKISTVQLSINNTLSTLLKIPVSSFGASRTDEGVHALCNFYHFDTDKNLPETFQYNMNAILPPSLAVKKIYMANDSEANARFDAISRKYRYRVYFRKNPFLLNRAFYFPLKIDRSLLKETADIIKEYTHFETFSKRNTQSRTFTCQINSSQWEETGDELNYIVEANRFLRGMVRALVGTQLQVARGKLSVKKFREVIESGDNTKADFSVEGFGLYLEEIKYPEGLLNELKFK
jgi:tRNA pseudouridine38-40 synthase